MTNSVCVLSVLENQHLLADLQLITTTPRVGFVGCSVVVAM